MVRRRPAHLLFWSWFNVQSFRAARGTEAWTEQRFRYWLSFTLPSVLAQTEPDWQYWLVCSRELRALTDSLSTAVTDPRVELVFEDQCVRRLARLPPADRYLLARLDSDDLYHPVTARTLLKQCPTTPFLQFNRGFALDVATGQVLPWRSRSSPFYTHVYGEDVRRLDTWAEPNHTTVARSATVLGSGHFLVSLHRANTSTTPAHAAGPPFPAERAAVIAGQFGLGRPRHLDDLVTTARTPLRWGPRWRQVCELLGSRLGDGSAAEGAAGTLPLAAAGLVRMATEITRARHVLVIGDERAASAVRACVPAPCEVVPAPTTAIAAGPSASELDPGPGADGTAAARRPHDVVFADLAGKPVSRHTVGFALDAVAETGLVVVAGVHPHRNRPDLAAAIDGVLCDSYPEVEDLTRDRSGTACWLLGRVLPRRRRDGHATSP